MPEVRSPIDDSWRTVTVPEARWCELMQFETKAQVATDVLARVTRAMEVYAKRVGIELGGNAETQLGQLVAEYRNRAERAEQEMDRIYGFCEGQLEVARVKAVGQHSYYRGVEVTALAVLATKHSNESQKPINLPLDAEATDLLERVLEHELEAQPTAAVEGTGELITHKGQTWKYTGETRKPRDGEHFATGFGSQVCIAAFNYETSEYRIVVKAEPAAAPPAETGEKWVPFPLMGGYCLLVNGLVATREQAEAAAEKANSPDDESAYVVYGKIAVLVSQDGASHSEAIAALRDIEAMEAVRKHVIDVEFEDDEWGAGVFKGDDRSTLISSYKADLADAILSLAAELERSEAK